MRRIPLALMLSVTLLAASFAQRPEEHGLEHHVPATTLAFLEVPDVSAMKAAFQGLGLVRLTQDPGVQAFLAPAMRFAERMLASEEQTPGWLRAAVQVAGALGLAEGQAAIALLDVAGDDGLPFTAVAAIDFRANRERFQEAAHRFLAQHGVPHERIAFAEHRVLAFDLGGMPLYATFVGSRLLACNSKAALEGILSGAHRASALGSTASFRDVRRRVLPGAPGGFLYASVPNLLALLDARMDAGMGAMENQLLDALGVRALGGVGYGLAFEGRDVVERFHVESLRENNPLLALVTATQPARHSVARWIPADAWWYSNAGLDLVAYYDLFVEIAMTMAGPEEVAQEIEDFETGVLGFRIRDALASFAPDVTFAMHAPPGGGLLPEITLYFGVADPARLADVGPQLVEVFGGMLEHEEGVSLGTSAHEYLGLTYHTLDVSRLHDDDPFPVRPAALIHDGQLVVTLVPLHMKNVIERIRAGGASPSVADAGPVHAARARAPQGHVQFDYADLTGLAGFLWNTGVPIAQAFLHGSVLADVPFELDFAHLPTARVVRQHVGPLVAWSERDAHGATVTMRSPCGIVPTLGLVAAVAIPMTVRQAQAAQAEAEAMRAEHERRRWLEEEEARRRRDGRDR